VGQMREDGQNTDNFENHRFGRERMLLKGLAPRARFELANFRFRAECFRGRALPMTTGRLIRTRSSQCMRS